MNKINSTRIQIWPRMLTQLSPSADIYKLSCYLYVFLYNYITEKLITLQEIC